MTLTTTPIDVEREFAGLRAELEAHVDPSYASGSARTVPSSLPSHAVRVSEVRRIAADWSRSHRDAAPEQVFAIAEALWATTWREERLVAIMLVARCKPLLASLPWQVVERWSSQIDNWEQVDHLAGAVTSTMLRARSELLDEIERLADSAHSWQRRLALVTLIVAAHRDPVWREALSKMAEHLRGDRGPTMYKALVWAKKVLRESEAPR